MTADAELGSGELAQEVRARRDGVRRHLRGSSLLLSGRIISLAINLGVQVLTVRYLAREDYGMFAWALVVVSMTGNLTLLGLDKTLARFVATYHERGDMARVLGAIVLGALCTGGLGTALVCGTWLARGRLPALLGADPAAVDLLLIMIAMGPLGAVDSALGSLFGAFGRARAIFIRRSFAGPLMKLASVVFVIGIGGAARELALAYLVSSALSVAVYAGLLARVVRDAEGGERPQRIVVPAREMLAYAVSLLAAELLFMFYDSFVTILLEYHHGASEVAGFQAVRPFAKLNDVALFTFAQLFVPALARFHARRDREGVAHLYGQTCVWITLLSFPIFAFTFGLADLVSVTLLGAQYADAGKLLAWMSAGFMAHALLGTNFHALRVLGFLRIGIAADLLAGAGALAVGLVLIPSAGPLGAAITLAVVLAGRGLLYLGALYWRSGLNPWAGFGSIYAVVLGSALGLVVVRQLAGGSWWLPGAAALAASLAVFSVARRHLDVADTFPELARIPGAKRLFPPRGPGRDDPHPHHN